MYCRTVASGVIRYLDIGSFGIPTTYMYPCRSNSKLLCQREVPTFHSLVGKVLSYYMPNAQALTLVVYQCRLYA